MWFGLGVVDLEEEEGVRERAPERTAVVEAEAEAEGGLVVAERRTAFVAEEEEGEGEEEEIEAEEVVAESGTNEGER